MNGQLIADLRTDLRALSELAQEIAAKIEDGVQTDLPAYPLHFQTFLNTVRAMGYDCRLVPGDGNESKVAWFGQGEKPSAALQSLMGVFRKEALVYLQETEKRIEQFREFRKLQPPISSMPYSRILPVLDSLVPLIEDAQKTYSNKQIISIISGNRSWAGSDDMPWKPLSKNALTATVTQYRKGDYHRGINNGGLANKKKLEVIQMILTDLMGGQK